jgi:hypothetical protein
VTKTRGKQQQQKLVLKTLGWTYAVRQKKKEEEEICEELTAEKNS